MKFSEYLKLPSSAHWYTDWNTCALCHEYFPEPELTNLQGSEAQPYVCEGFICTSCLPAALNYYRAECPLCGIIGHRAGNFRAVLGTGGADVCPLCSEQYLWRPDERTRVSTQLTRARKHGLDATLTVVEWIQNLIDFDRRCAYCGGPYTSMDHYTSIRQGGGTTAQNCVPACTACNFDKDKPIPRRVTPEKMAAVGAYLANRTQRTPVTTQRVGKAFPVLARYMLHEVSADNPYSDRLAALLGLE